MTLLLLHYDYIDYIPGSWQPVCFSSLVLAPLSSNTSCGHHLGMESALVYLIIDLQTFFLLALLPIITYCYMYLTVITKFFVINLKLHVVPLVTIWNKDSTYSYFQHGYFSLYTLVEDFLPKKFCLNKYNLFCYNSLILNSSTDIETIWAGIVLLENEILIHVLYYYS